MMEKQRLLIAGTGFLAKDVADLAEDSCQFEVAGFVIDQPPFERGTKILGKPVLWIDELEDLDGPYVAICAIYKIKKIAFIEKIKTYQIPFVNFIHLSSRVSGTVEMGEGNIIKDGVHISACSRLGNHIIINRGVLIGHDVTIGDYSVASPGVNIAGNVTVGPRTFIGQGAILVPNITIGTGCYIGAGSLVNRNLPDRVRVVGSPVKIIERDIEEF